MTQLSQPYKTLPTLLNKFSGISSVYHSKKSEGYKTPKLWLITSKTNQLFHISRQIPFPNFIFKN